MIEFFVTYGKDILDAITYTITAASIIAKMTENKLDDTITAQILDVLSLAKKPSAR